MARRRTKAEETAIRVRHLIALDATNVMRRLSTRQDEMVTLFSRLRDRAPMLETIASGFGTIQFDSLAALSIDEQTAINAFYESLAELRWYLEYTEDMPLTVRKTSARHARRLQLAFENLIGVLGSPRADGAPVVDADVITRDEAEPQVKIKALIAGEKRSGR